MKENTSYGGWITFVIILVIVFAVGFGVGRGFETNPSKEEIFYRGMYTQCVITTNDEVNCLTQLRDPYQKAAYFWKQPFFTWPLPEEVLKKW